MADNDPADILTLEPPSATIPCDRRLSILGVEITDVSKSRAIELIEQAIRSGERCTQSFFFVNAHTLNLAAADRSFRRLLGESDYVFGDGTGVRWAARLQGICVRDNLNGTDLIPSLMRATAGRGYRYFLLGADQDTIGRAADYALRQFPGWEQVGCHHGYLHDRNANAEAIKHVHRARPDVLLVGMGNPIQEQWVRRHQSELNVPVCMAIGGLFDFWAENVSRAPRWLRKLGHEWIWRIVQRPGDKWRRYLLGNPLFLARVLRERLRQRT